MEADSVGSENTTLELRCRIDRAFGISRDVGKRWFDAARGGDLRTMKMLLETVQDSADGSWRLAHYNGQGTSYGFVGSIALHWACAAGDVAMAELLLELGSGVNCQNFGGSTPLHSAVANVQPRTTLLLLSRGANLSITDCCGDSPLDISEQREALAQTSREKMSISEVRRALLAYQLSLSMAEQDEQKWSNDNIRTLVEIEARLSKSGLPPPVEKAACIAVCRSTIASIRQAVALAAQGDVKARDFLTTIRSREVERQRQLAERQVQPPLADDDSDDEAERVAYDRQMAMSEKLKNEGNELFRSGELKEAVKRYTAAIALNANDPTFYSNRSACYLGMGNGVLAAQDARTAIDLRPSWAKGHYRLGCAMSLLGRWDSATLCFEQSLVLQPDDPSATAGLAAAREECEKMATDQRIRAASGGSKRPWFDCSLCTNRTRDKVVAPCCAKELCGTCWSRRQQSACPFCSTVST